jgi:hypothetical protein
MTSTAIRIDEMKKRGNFHRAIKSRTRRDTQNLAAFVITARRTNPVWYIRRGTLRANAQLRQFQHAVVSAALTHPAFRWLTFWDAHKINSKSQF